MSPLIAIGGGDSRKYGPVLRRIVTLPGKKHPRVLFIPTASKDSGQYVENMQKVFAKQGCTFDVLYLMFQDIAPKEIKRKIRAADILYVGGGNTLMMMKRWRELGVDRLLIEAHRKGKVLCGVSAGAICWFRSGNSDSLKYANPKAPYINVGGLGLIDAVCCPHYNTEPARKESLKQMMKRLPGVAIALEDFAALEVTDGRCRILVAKKNTKAWKIWWEGKKFHKQRILADSDFSLR